VIFFALAKMFAIGEGLLPDSPRLERVLRRVTLEACLLAGFALLAAGGGGLIVSAGSLRIVIPSVTVLVVGLQVIMFGFFLSLLRLRRTPTWPSATMPADDSIEVEAVHPDDGSRLRIRLGSPGVPVVDLEAAASGEA
jgi:fatty acid desaturase